MFAKNKLIQPRLNELSRLKLMAFFFVILPLMIVCLIKGNNLVKS